MSIRKSILYKSLVKKYVEYKLECRIRAHEREIELLNSFIDAHEEVLKMLRKREVRA